MADIYEILLKLESLGFLKTHKRVGNYMQIYCPFHNDGKERKPSCGVLLHEEVRGGRKYPQGWTHCFTCSYANSLPEMITDLLKIRNISKSGMDWLIENIPDFDGMADNDFELLIPSDVINTLNEQYAISYIQSLSKPKQQYVSEEELASYRFTVPYMYERKLTDEIIEKFDVGYDANWIAPGRKKATPCITFPVRNKDGKTLFLCRRSVQGKFFNYPTGVTKPVYGLYELPENCKSVIICESCFNALTCWVYGKPAVALLGTGNSYQIQQLKELGVHEFILAFDPDDAGRKATEKLKRSLKHTAIVWSFEGIPAGKDINDLTKEEFEALTLV
ncbi:MAG: toprim domain-containing protein [Clostridium sp.]|nr:toprim domain-containing protein [Clostridium sp.]